MLPRFRSKSFRKIPKREGRSRYVRKRGGDSRCAICGSKLSGGWGSAKSKKRPERAFGGVLCARCSFEVLKTAGKVAGGYAKLESEDAEVRRFVRQLVKR